MDGKHPSNFAIDIIGQFPADHAMKGEFDAAIASRSIGRLKLFVERFPNTQQARQAEELIQELRKRDRR